MMKYRPNKSQAKFAEAGFQIFKTGRCQFCQMIDFLELMLIPFLIFRSFPRIVNKDTVE